MDVKFGLKTFAATTCLILAGCMSTNQDQNPESQANAEKLKFVNTTTTALAQAAATQPTAGATQAPEVDFDALGCPKLGKLMKDLGTNTGNGLPASAEEFLACFGISGAGSVEDIDGIVKKIQEELPQILDCACGNSSLSALLAGKTIGFSGAAAAAATSSFSGASSTGAGTGFNGTSSTGAAGGFTGK